MGIPLVVVEHLVVFASWRGACLKRGERGPLRRRRDPFGRAALRRSACCGDLLVGLRKGRDSGFAVAEALERRTSEGQANRVVGSQVGCHGGRLIFMCLQTQNKQAGWGHWGDWDIKQE